MKYYEFTGKNSFSGGKPVQSGIARVPNNHPLELIESEIPGVLRVAEFTLTSVSLDLEKEFRQHEVIVLGGDPRRTNLTQSRTANGHEYRRIKGGKEQTKIAAKEHKERKNLYAIRRHRGTQSGSRPGAST